MVMLNSLLHDEYVHAHVLIVGCMAALPKQCRGVPRTVTAHDLPAGEVIIFVTVYVHAVVSTCYR